MAGASSDGAGSGSGATDLAQLIVPLTAVVAVLASLAAAGVIAAAERNHGDHLLWGLGLVVGSAAFWLLALLVPTTVETKPPPKVELLTGETPFGGFTITRETVVETPPEESPPEPPADWWEYYKRKFGSYWTTAAKWIAIVGRPLLRFVAIGLLVAGIVYATKAIVDTQRDSQRPAVSASFDPEKGVLSSNVAAEGLSTDQRMTIRVDGLRQLDPNADRVEPVDPHSPLYFALLGPDGSGKVKYAFKVYVPPKYDIVSLEAWTASSRPGCFDIRSRRQSEEAGCVITRLKPDRTS
jgi:hypothetical protein